MSTGDRSDSRDESDQPAVCRWDWGWRERRWDKDNPDQEIRQPKTGWDIAQLLVIPLALVGIGLGFNFLQASRESAREDQRAAQAQTLADQRIEEDRRLAREARLDDTLQTYLSQMNDLMLHRRLVRALRGSTVKNVARSLTLTTLRRLDGQRKGEVVRFLYEANLLRPPWRALDLTGADLREVDLANSELVNTSFAQTDLRGAHFDSAFLLDTDFTGTLLAKASFRRSELSGVQFSSADLTGAKFDHARLLPSYSDVGLRSTFLFASCLSRTSFVGARFVHVDLGESEGRVVNFSEARFLDRFFERRFKRSVLAEGAGLTEVKLDGAQGAPGGWGTTVPRKVTKSKAEHPCAGLNLSAPATTAQPLIRHYPVTSKKSD
jgi:uncharacterized protein YjbI with pentapeptide repeats